MIAAMPDLAQRHASPTLTIDDPDDGGSEAGAWAIAIAHSPCLIAIDLDGFTDEKGTHVND